MYHHRITITFVVVVVVVVVVVAMATLQAVQDESGADAVSQNTHVQSFTFHAIRCLATEVDRTRKRIEGRLGETVSRMM